MAIDIFGILPNVISRDLTGKSFLIYGDRKVGKTTCACKFPKPFLMAFEKGYGLIDGIRAYNVNSWKDAIEAKKQLIKNAEQCQKDGNETFYKTV